MRLYHRVYLVSRELNILAKKTLVINSAFLVLYEIKRFHALYYLEYIRFICCSGRELCSVIALR